MPKFQVHDTVALKADKTFIGNVERTSQFESEPLQECLIIAHTDVPQDVLQAFVNSGKPPDGYAFVQFASQEQGYAVVAENDLTLLDRLLELGDITKRQDSSMSGVVINVSSTYALDPVWQPILSTDGFCARPASSQPITNTHTCNELCNPLETGFAHPCPCRLIPNVPFTELKRAQDFVEGDYIMDRDWLGMVDAVDKKVVLRLENDSVVVVSEYDELFIPIPDYGKPLVSLPEFDGIPRPHIVSAKAGWGNLIPPEDIECGQFVVTSHRNLRNGRWLRGSFNPEVKPEGYVIMVRSEGLHMVWMICNAFTPEQHWDAAKPSYTMPYENLSTFPAPQEIRRDRSVVLCDPGKPAAVKLDRTRAAVSDGESQIIKNTTPVNLSSNFNVGQRVKFRDAAGAAVKYQGRDINSVLHGRFDRIWHTDTLGYDLNEFIIVQSRQTATVRWQDGSCSELPSVSLIKSMLFENDLMPSDIVVAREGMMQRKKPTSTESPSAQYSLSAFNEMTLFETAHDLIPAKVGVVQNVNPTERVATIRWFQNPSLRITQSGNALGAESRFGIIGQEVEDVSLYEVMTFPGLVRRIRDMIVTVPSSVSRRAVEVLSQILPDDLFEVDACVTALSQLPDRHPVTLLEWMQHNAWLNMDLVRQGVVVSPEQYKPHHATDWIGEICQLQTDGQVVIRVNKNGQARDLTIDHDQILAFVDEQVWGIDYNEDPMSIDGDDTDDTDSDDNDEQVLEETVEYEGGQRLDHDASDENWESEDESSEPPQSIVISEDRARARAESVAMADAYPGTKFIEDTTAVRMKQPSDSRLGPSLAESTPSKVSLNSYRPSEEPPSFLSLEQEPPSDQFQASQSPRTSPQFLKRIAKEHRILSTSLPPREIYVRTYDNRLDLMRCLILGPIDTPYEFAPFLIDLHFGSGFPKEPPTAHFHSWTSGLGRINPNLYEEGKICLSLLGTWPGKSETEGWTEKATVLQLLMSLQGLVFVNAPFYNEAGFEGYENTPEYTNESLQYTEKAYVMARNFVKHALTSPVQGLEDVLAWLYLPKSHHDGQLAALYEDQSSMLKVILTRSRALIDRSDELKGPSKQLGGEDDDGDRLLSGDGSSTDPTKNFMRPLSKGAIVMLSKNLKSLEDVLCNEILLMAASVAEKSRQSS